ncbi:hypothetical protein ScPMuIL_014512 [Solemya velum]
MPTFLLSILPGKRQIVDSTLSNHDTSIILRVKQQVPVVNPDVEKEALAAMNLALDMQAQGKNEKAMKLYQHALALDPQHADILTAYGEFLEVHEKDVLQAEYLYRELIQREIIYMMCLPHIQVEEGEEGSLLSPYISHQCHRGNTLTLSQTRAIVETRIAIGGKSLLEQNEVLGLDAALSYINSTLMGRIGSVKLSDILEIHKRVLGYVDPLEAGRIRTTQVFVGDFTPPPPTDLAYLMDKFINWLNEETSELHPIEFAALAHYKLVTIHPFYDGNGRTSRLLMNLILMQAGFPPVTIKVQDRHEYYEVLNKGNSGDIRPFIRFIAECTERTLNEFLLATLDQNAATALQLLNFTDSDKVISVPSGEH